VATPAIGGRAITVDKEQRRLSGKLDPSVKRMQGRPPGRFATLVFLRDVKRLLEDKIEAGVENGRTH